MREGLFGAGKGGMWKRSSFEEFFLKKSGTILRYINNNPKIV